MCSHVWSHYDQPFPNERHSSVLQSGKLYKWAIGRGLNMLSDHTHCYNQLAAGSCKVWRKSASSSSHSRSWLFCTRINIHQALQRFGATQWSDRPSNFTQKRLKSHVPPPGWSAPIIGDLDPHRIQCHPSQDMSPGKMAPPFVQAFGKGPPTLQTDDRQN